MTESEIKDGIRSEMDHAGVSMSELARRIGVSRNTLNNYFNRGRTIPLCVLLDILQALGVRMEVRR